MSEKGEVEKLKDIARRQADRATAYMNRAEAAESELEHERAARDLALDAQRAAESAAASLRERVAELVKHADLLRFWLNKLVTEASVMGDDMDAPARFPEIEAVTHHSLEVFIGRYDEARAELGASDGTE